MMNRTITVKGIGKASAKPDQVVLSMVLESKHQDYDQAMERAAVSIGYLNDAMEKVGFEKGTVKTTNFQVSTDYDRVKDRNGEYRSVFAGYLITHNLKMTFDFTTERLSQALSAISRCLARPQLTVAFTVKDAAAIHEEMLRSATVNARKKAEILCQASGTCLGELVSIDYSWAELDIYSPTRYDCCEEVMPRMASSAVEIEPEDIDVRDTVTFVWEIQQGS